MSDKADLHSVDRDGRDEVRAQEDSTADAIAAVVLIAIFVIACVYWVAGQ